MPDRAHLKSVLEASRIQLDNVIKRVDSASAEQLAEIRGMARTAAAFVDFNSGCGKGSIATSGHELLSKIRG